MRRRLQRFFPIVLIALMVQIFAPVAACWPAAIAVSHPLGAAAICHGSGGATTDQGGDQVSQHREQGAACSICCLASVSVSSIRRGSRRLPIPMTGRRAWPGTITRLFNQVPASTPTHERARRHFLPDRT